MAFFSRCGDINGYLLFPAIIGHHGIYFFNGVEVTYKELANNYSYNLNGDTDWRPAYVK